jgi:putative membrane protein
MSDLASREDRHQDPVSPAPDRRPREPLALLAVAAIALVASGIGPWDRATWWMEVAPVLIGAPILIATWRRFPLTPLLYRLLLIHALILILGGHYTYARVPLGSWIQDGLELSRNPYDRIGHFAQGFVPAILAREILLRHRAVRAGGWCFFVVVCVALGFSAFYELIEWWAAIAWGAAAEDFLGTQGDVWDTQWDMCLALLGAIVALVFLGPLHDHALARMSIARSARAAPSG